MKTDIREKVKNKIKIMIKTFIFSYLLFLVFIFILFLFDQKELDLSLKTFIYYSAVEMTSSILFFFVFQFLMPFINNFYD